jgi:hypothetical protein
MFWSHADAKESLLAIFELSKRRKCIVRYGDRPLSPDSASGDWVPVAKNPVPRNRSELQLNKWNGKCQTIAK